MKPILARADLLDRVRRQDRLVRAGVRHVGREVVERRALGTSGRRRSSGCPPRRRRRGSRRRPSAGAPCSPRRTRGCRRRSTSRPSDVHRLDATARRGRRPRAAARRRSGHPRRRSASAAVALAGLLRGGWRGTPRRRRSRSRRPACRSSGRSGGRPRCGPTSRPGASRLPWKSLNESSCTARASRASCRRACPAWSGLPFWAVRALAPSGAAVAVVEVAVSEARAQVPAARTPIRRRDVRCMRVLQTPPSWDHGRLTAAYAGPAPPTSRAYIRANGPARRPRRRVSARVRAAPARPTPRARPPGRLAAGRATPPRCGRRARRGRSCVGPGAGVRHAQRLLHPRARTRCASRGGLCRTSLTRWSVRRPV